MDEFERQVKIIEEAQKKLTEGMASEKDLKDVLELVLNVIEQLKTQIEAKIVENKGEMDGLFSGVMKELVKVKQAADFMSDSLEARMAVDKKKVQKQIEQSVNSLLEKIPTLPDLEPIEARLAVLEAPEPEEIDDPYEARNELEALEGDERLDKSAIKGLEDEIKKLRDEIKVAGTSKGGVRRVYQPHRDDFSSQTDGSKKSFGLTREPLSAETVMVFGSDFPIILRPIIDFTITGRVITLTDAIQAPSQGATLIVFYFA